MRRRDPWPRGGVRSAAVLLVLVLSMVGCGGCSPSYVVRSAYEEARILLSREPIETVLANPALPGEKRAQLELVLAVRKFAADELGMNVGGAYSALAEVRPGALLWVVSAAQQTRLQPVRWWFPVVGDVTYKGFFERADADHEAAGLQAEGYDTFVRSSSAFSTLGWFDDPVLSSWLTTSPVDLTTLVLHELLHRTTYAAGETDFNESFATFVGHRGAVAFFAQRDGEKAATTEEARADWRDALSRSERIGRAVDELEALYQRASKESWPRAKTLEERQKIFAQLGPAERINNAVIVANFAYLSHLDRFDCYPTASPEEVRIAIERISEATEDADRPFAALPSCTQGTESAGGVEAPAGG